MSRAIGPGGLALLAHFEQGPAGGFAARPYQGAADKPGVLTCGYGHVIRPGDHLDFPLNSTQALALLETDVQNAADIVDGAVRVKLTDYQRDALICFAFNVGGPDKWPTLQAMLNSGYMLSASRQLLAYNRSNGKRRSGLNRRRMSEQVLFQTGQLDFYPAGWEALPVDR